MRKMHKGYGKSVMRRCPFCGRQATTANSQGLLVCVKHKNALIGEMRCVCGDYLDLVKGKGGAHFRCLRCGNINMGRVLQVNDVVDVSKRREESPGKKDVSGQD